jgi:MFS family permease
MKMHDMTTARSEWRANWPVVLVGFLGVTLATMHIYSIGAMIGSIERELGWSRAQISSGLTISSVIGVIMAPLVGAAIDRFGPRRIAIAGCALYCLTIGLLSTAASLWSWRATWIGIALGQAFIAPTVWTAAVSSLFVTHRGMAQALTLSGTGLGVGLMPILTTMFIDLLGWRKAYVALGVSWAILLIPLLFLFLHSAIDSSRRMASPAGPAAAASLPGLSARDGFRSRAFIILATAAIVYSLALSGVAVNMVPILISHGLGHDLAATITGGMAIGVIIGRLSAGFLFDRINARYVTGLSTGLSIVSALILLLYPGSVPLATIAVFVYGILLGPTVSGFAFLATQHFGLRAFGTLFGVIVGLLILASGVAPMLVSYVYDVTHSYRLVLVAAVPGSLLTAVLFLMMGDYPDLPNAADEPA